MTFEEKYKELFSKYEKAGKEMEKAISKLSSTNGFGDMGDVASYYRAHRDLNFHEQQFQRLLNYIQEGKIDPETEFVEHHFMYDFIKSDQIKKGTDWEEHELYPGQGRSKFYSCEIGLTNDPEVKRDFQRSNYKFPVLNLAHGKESYAYLSSKLQYNEKDTTDVSSLDFSKVIDESKPIFVKVSMRTD